MPLVSSNLCAARIRPRLPSLIRSASDTPWFWYFLATETTKRRLLRTSLSSASGSPSPDALRERDFFLLRNQRITADLSQILVQRALVERWATLAGPDLHRTHTTRPLVPRETYSFAYLTLTSLSPRNRTLGTR